MELNKETFTMEDLKKLLREAFEFDYDKHKGKVKFLPLTIVEWHKSDVYKELLSFDNIKGNILEWRRPFDACGTYFFNQKSFVILFQRTNIIKLLEYRGASIDELLVFYLFAIFHELQHHYQGEFRGVIKSYEEANFSTFAYDIDCFAFSYNPQDYDKHHDEYWAEIGANLYGIDRVYEFLESKGMLTEKIEKILQKYKNKYLFDLNNYDIHYFLYRAHEILKKNLGINLGDWGFICLFYKSKQQFRTIDEILEFANECNLDKKILNYFFSSIDFLNSLDFNSLSLENKQVIMNAIEYAVEIEIKRRKKNREFLQNKQISPKVYLLYDARICSKIAYFNKKLEELKKTMGLSNINETVDKLQR